MYINTHPSSLLLLCTVAVASTLSHLAWTSPNPPPRVHYQDSKGLPPEPKDPVRLIRTMNLIMAISHCVVIVISPFPPWTALQPSPARDFLCPNLHLLSASPFSWSPFTILCQTAIILAASLRLLCFRALGPDFSFQLARPGKLRTGGLYAWVQHPSYTGSVLLLLGNICFLYRIDGAQGCWIPTGWRFVAACVNWGSWALFAVLLVLSTRQRVMLEEEMLREAFGREWEVWHARTKRFIPGVF